MKILRKLFIVFISSLALSACQQSPFDDGPLEPIIDGNSDETTDVINEDIKINSITFNDDNISIPINGSYRLYPNILPENATNKNLEYISSDSSICNVEINKGILYGFKEGDVIITIKAKDGSNVLTTVNVNVYKIPVSNIQLSSTSEELLIGDSVTLTYDISPDNATYKEINVISGNDELIDVTTKNNEITITGKKKGNTFIKVENKDDKEKYVICSIIINEILLEKISFSLPSIDVHIDDTFSPGIVYYPANATNKEYTYEISDESIIQYENNQIKALKIGSSDFVITSKENSSLKAALTINVYSKDTILKTPMLYTYEDMIKNGLYNCDICPSKGNPKLLIAPIWFTDSYAFIKTSNREVVRQDIEKAYLGSNEETGWRSVKTYYEEDSFNHVSIDGVVTDWYECGYSYLEAAKESSGAKITSNIVNAVVNNYKRQHNDNMTSFDLNNNGYLDGVILIYAAPDYIAFDRSNYEENYGNLWAYCSWNGVNKPNVSSPTANAYFWASYDFMYDKETSYIQTGGQSNYAQGDCSYLEVDAHTYIHEMGHIFGLDDLYDYNSRISPAGDFSMQDNNVGAHDPFSRLALGWINPYLITDDAEITIHSIESSGDVVMIKEENNRSPFDEYLLLELYSPTGLNQFDAEHQYDEVYPQGPNKVGIRIWHVDARLLYAIGSSPYYFNSNNLTTDPYIDGYKVWTVMDNTSDDSRAMISSFAKYDLLRLIRKDKTKSINCNESLSDDDLFISGDKFDMYDYYQQFVNHASYSSQKAIFNNGKEFNYSIAFSNLNDDSITINIAKLR